jgi:hypothetical protein
MNNATTVRALAAAVIVVVVLIFTTGTLAAATATSSFTPQPHNLICIHPGNNTTCSQERIISTTTQIPLPTPSPTPQPSTTLTIIKDIINDIVGTIFAKDFTSSASDSNVSPQSSFPGARFSSATVTMPGTFPVVLLQQANSTTTGAASAVVADHNKCSSGDIITCIHNKETHHPAKDTTPFVLPIPFP